MATLDGRYYAFTITAGNATTGATYTHNGFTYTVRRTIVGATKVYTSAANNTSNPLTSGTLTLATGTGDATLTFSAWERTAHINAIPYVANEALVVSGGQLLLVDESNLINPGNINIISNVPGRFLVTNSSTTTPIVWNFGTEVYNFLVNGAGNLGEFIGGWIQVATGTGLAGQTINFASIGGVSIDVPPFVLVQTGDSRHKLMTVNGTTDYFCAFLNAGQTTDTQALNILTTFAGNIDHGWMFQYDRTTRVATFGNGGTTATTNGGAVIPNGAKVFYPNIHLTSGVFATTLGNRNEIAIQSGGNLNMRNIALSRNFIMTTLGAAGNVTLENVGLFGKTQVPSTQGTVTIDGWFVAPDSTAAVGSNTTPIQLTTNYGDVYVRNIWCFYKTSATYAPGIQFGSTSKYREIGKIWSMVSTTATGAYPIIFDSLSFQEDYPLVCGPWYIIGGRFFARNSLNFHVEGIYHSDTTTSNQQTGIASDVAVFAQVTNGVVKTIRNLSSTSSTARNIVTSMDAASTQCAMHDIIYDGRTNTGVGVVGSGNRMYYANATLNNLRSTNYSSGTGLQNVFASNIIGNTNVTMATASTNTILEGVNGSATSLTASPAFDVFPFYFMYTNSSKTAGTVFIPPPSLENNTEYLTVVSGVEGVDWYVNLSTIYYEGSGVELIYTNPFPLRGIASFSGGSWTIAGGTPTTGATIEVSMKYNTPTSTWGSWFDATVAANWQTALSAISGYDDAKGLFFRYRIKTTTALAGRRFQYARMTCTPDSTWTPYSVGYIPIDISGYVANSTCKFYENDVPASPVDIWTYTVTGASQRLELPYNFNATAKPFKLKFRKSGYGEVVLTGSSYQKGKSVPVSQTQYMVVDDSLASAITGITVDGVAKTVTWTGTKSIDDLYAYTQWWSTQFVNMDYEIPLVTVDGGSNYSSTYSFTGDSSGTGTLITTGTYTGSSTLVVKDSVGVRCKITSGGGTFTIKGATIAYDDDITEKIVTVAPNTDVSFVMWKLGYKPQLFTINSGALGGTFNISMLDITEAVDVGLNVNPVIANTTTTVDGSGYHIYFDGTNILNAEIVKATTHRLMKYENYFNAVIVLNDDNVAEVLAEKLKVNKPLFTVNLPDGVHRSELQIYVDTDEAKAIDPLYVFNPSNDVGLYVNYIPVPVTVDYSYMKEQVWTNPTRTLTSGGSGGATPEEIWAYSDRTLTSGGGGGGFIRNVGLDATDKKYLKETHEKVLTLENAIIPDYMEKLNEIDSHIELAKTDVIDTIKETETEVCSDIIRKTKELKDDNVKTRNLVRQKTEKINKKLEKDEKDESEGDEVLEILREMKNEKEEEDLLEFLDEIEGKDIENLLT